MEMRSGRGPRGGAFKVSILVDGRECSSRAAVEARPHYRDQNRYHGCVEIIRLTDTETGTERVAVAQRIARPPAAGRAAWDFPEKLLRYRVLLIGADGPVSEEVYSTQDRTQPPYRTMLAGFVTPFDIGFHSVVLQVWPSVFYPILCLWATGAAGRCMLAIGPMARLLRHGKTIRA